MSNLYQRALTGILYVAILVNGMIWNEHVMLLMFTLIAGALTYEFISRMNDSGRTDILYFMPALMSMCFTGLLYNSAIKQDITGRIVLFIVIAMLFLVSELYRKKENALNNMAFTIFVWIYIALPISTINLLADYTPHYALPLSVFIFIWLNDTGAYCVGSLIGKHKLFPRISPKKSWEGAIGGAVFAIVSSLLMHHCFPNLLTWYHWIGLAAVVVVFGTWGDLVESLIKRQLGIKDSGTFFPGHGGWLDRFDSALLAIPAAAFYVYILNY